VIFVPVLRHRLAVVDRLVVRLDIGVVAPVLEAAIAPREVGRMVALMRHLRRVYLGADLALRLVVSWASCSTGQKSLGRLQPRLVGSLRKCEEEAFAQR
jgi:hypothetical protein